MRFSRSIPTLLLLAFMAAPASASAMTQTDLSQQVQALLAQIALLTKQLVAVETASSTAATALGNATSNTAASASPSVRCPALSRALSVGTRGNDVLSLQHFLEAQGELDSSSLTGYFGPLTQAAVQHWQSSHSVVSSGSPSTTGWGVVGGLTRAAIEKVCGHALAAPNAIGASIQVAQTAGDLAVNATITTNTGNTCDAQTYTLTWGDGSSSQTISVPEGECAALAQEFHHTYAAPGTYTVSVASGSAQANAQITLAAASTCTPPLFTFNAVPGGVVGVPYALALISYPEASSSVTLAASALPAGLSLVDTASTSTGPLMHTWTLTGTPTEATTTAITLSANNTCGTGQINFTLPVTQ